MDTDTAWQVALQRPREMVAGLEAHAPRWTNLSQTEYGEIARVAKRLTSGEKLKEGLSDQDLLSFLHRHPVNAHGKSALVDLLESILPQVEINTRRDPLWPATLIQAREVDRRKGRFAEARWVPAGSDQCLPGYSETCPDGPVMPAVPIALYGLRQDKQHGAPLAARIFVDAVLAVPLEHWPSGPVLLPPMSLGEFLGRLYPNPRTWQRGKDLDALLRAFEQLEDPQTRMPCLDPATGEWTPRQVVWAVHLPESGHRDDTVQMGVYLPSGTQEGAILDRPAALQAGTKSMAAWSLVFSLAAHWHQPGVLRIPGNGGFRQTHKIGRYPEITDSQLIAMAFPYADTSGHAPERARKALRYLEDIGYAKVTPKRRIMPGSSWAGWNAAD